MAKILIGRKLNFATDSVTVAQGTAGGSAWLVAEVNKLVPTQFDYIEVTSKNAEGCPTEVEYKTGGSGGIVVATLTITYDVDGDLESVART